MVSVRPHVDPATRAASGTFVVLEGAQGEFPIVAGEGQRPRLALAGPREMGALVPPPPANLARAAQRLPPGGAPRLARDVLQGRALDDATREIADVWPRMHL